MLGISFDSVEENKAFADKFDYPFKLLSDATRHVGLAFGAAASAVDGYAKRYTFLIDEDGYVLESIDTQNPEAQAEVLLELL